MRPPTRIQGYTPAEAAAAREIVAVAEDHAMHGVENATAALEWLRGVIRETDTTKGEP